MLYVCGFSSKITALQKAVFVYVQAVFFHSASETMLQAAMGATSSRLAACVHDN
jgi:hypothetical protein